MFKQQIFYKFIKKFLRFIIKIPGVNFVKINLLREVYPETLLIPEELLFISKSILKYPKCKFLVFGMGYDSLFWLNINKNGRTVFLEDNEEWLQKITKLSQGIEAYLVNYPTKIAQWEYLKERPHELEIILPEQVLNINWDVILVDGPSGDYEYYIEKYGIEPPGRMISIYMASKLIKNAGDVFVHDCDREIERVYSDKYLLKENFEAQVKGVAILRQYKGSLSSANKT